MDTIRKEQNTLRKKKIAEKFGERTGQIEIKSKQMG